MHELSLAQELIEQIIEVATHEHAVRVERVVVVIGTYSGVEPEAFEFAFPFAAENTVSEGAELVIEEETPRAVCNTCHFQFVPNLTLLICEKCGSDDVTLQGGREFMIRSIDLEVP